MSELKAKIIEHKLVESASDIARWGTIRWSGLNGYWPSTVEAVEQVGKMVSGRFMVTVIEDDMRLAPERDDWPADWTHVGTKHNKLARIWWNYFHHRIGSGKIWMSDEPDFYGHIEGSEGNKANIWGDIGEVSVSTFVLSLRRMRVGDLWISVLGYNLHLLLESQWDFQTELMHKFGTS